MKLSAKQSELAARVAATLVAARHPAGHRVTEEQLTSEFRVSRSPVRAVMHFLASKGFLVPRDRGFFIPERMPDLDPDSSVIPKSADQELVDCILRDRAKDLVPEQISEAEFMRRYDVPRSQLLRVLNRLSLDGVVERAAGHGWNFLPTLNTESTYHDSYRFRIILEPAAIMEATFAPDRPKLRSLREAHLDLARSSHPDQGKLLDLNASLHETIALCSHNVFIIEAVRRHSRLRRLNERLSHDEGRARERIEEHLAIIDAILEDQREWAAAQLKRHLEIASQVAPAFQSGEP